MKSVSTNSHLSTAEDTEAASEVALDVFTHLFDVAEVPIYTAKFQMHK